MDTKFIAKIQNLISDNQTLTAIELLLNAIESKEGEDYDTLLLLKSRYTRAKQQESLGIISFSDGLRDQTQISYAVLNMLKTFEAKKEPNLPKNPLNQKETILFLASASDGRLQLEKEFVQIGISLQETYQENFRLVSAWAVTPSRFQTEILKQKPAVLHFSGHGETEGIMLQDSSGKDQFVYAEALTNFFKIFAKKFPIKIVFLNCCYSQEQAKTISKYVPYVIGMNRAIEDPSAIQFSTSFYQTYASEKDVEFAFDLAVNSIAMDSNLGDAEVPVIYINGKMREPETV